MSFADRDVFSKVPAAHVQGTCKAPTGNPQGVCKTPARLPGGSPGAAEERTGKAPVVLLVLRAFSSLCPFFLRPPPPPSSFRLTTPRICWMRSRDLLFNTIAQDLLDAVARRALRLGVPHSSASAREPRANCRQIRPAGRNEARDQRARGCSRPRFDRFDWSILRLKRPARFDRFARWRRAVASSPRAVRALGLAIRSDSIPAAIRSIADSWVAVASLGYGAAREAVDGQNYGTP